MTLVRQLFFVISLMFLLVFAGTFAITVDNTRRFLAEQLQSHAQDTATSLGLSLSPHMGSGEVLLMESMVDAIFDRGYYREISVRSLDGTAIIERNLDIRVHGVPQWFLRWVPLETPRASARIMAGWKQGGQVDVVSHPGFAYGKLWLNALETFGWSMVTLFIAILLTGLILRLILRSLRAVEAQALAIADREFPRQQRIPRTRELNRVVVAMNKMTGKVEEMLSEYHNRAERLREAVYVDPLTGLGNQQAFERDLQRLVSHREEHAFGAVMLVSASGLEEANRRGGYGGGDKFLRAVGSALLNCVETHEGSASRLAGSLFGVMVPDIARAGIDELLDRIVQGVGAARVGDLAPAGVNAVLAYYGGGQSTGTLRERAEAALHNAENSGPDTWHVYDATETAGGRDVYHETQWDETLRKVLEDRAVVLLFQPVKSPDLGTELHREVLARIRPGGEELVSAGLFFPMAARVGLTAGLDKLIVELALEHLAQAAPGIRLAINLSRQSVADPEFTGWLSRTLAVQSSLASRLAFEVTEQLAVAEADKVLDIAARLREAGVAFGVDHCGARDVALDYMKQLKANYTKIDGAFIKHLDEDAEKQAYVTSLVEFGHALEFKVIAEYVETEQELRLAATLGFDGVQGHLVGLPG